MTIIDGDSHFMEPLDLFARYIDPAFRDKALRVAKDPSTGTPTLVVDGRSLGVLNTEEVLAGGVGYGQKEEGHDLRDFDRTLGDAADWQDMSKRTRFLDTGGIDKGTVANFPKTLFELPFMVAQKPQPQHSS